MIADELGRIPMSPHLVATLTRAANYADAQAHVEVTLEHVLLALTEDNDAGSVMQLSSVDIGRLSADVSAYLGRIEERRPAGSTATVLISNDLKKILEAAAAAAQQGRRKEINGAIVLAAVVGDGESTAAHLLAAQGLTFEVAIRALQKATAQQAAPKPAPEPAAAPAPAAIQATAPIERTQPPQSVQNPQNTDDILAAARERIQTRTAPPAAVPVATPDAAVAVGAGPKYSAEPAATRAPAPMPDFATAAPAPAPAPAQPVHYESAALTPVPVHYDTRQQPSGYAGQAPAPHWQPLPNSGPAPGQPSPAAGPQPWPNRAPAPAPAMPPMAPPRSAPPVALPPHPSAMPRGPYPPQSAPNAPPMMDPRAAPPRQRQGGPAGNVRVATGQLVENIPRAMRIGIPMIVEARVARAEVKAIAEGLQGGGAVYRHEVMVTKAMSVRLRAPEGGFYIETSSPETQWIENVLGLMADDFASWRWTVTPNQRGKKRLQLVISARTVGADGLAAETALPDQVIEVKVGINFGKTLLRWGGWIAAAIIGGVLAKLGEGLYTPALAVVSKLMGG